MRKVIRKRIRHKREGLDLAVDFNADVAVNVGRSRSTPVEAGEEGRREDDPPRPEAGEEEGKQP